ncbi:peroxidase-related enzyme [Tunturibacter empetritectus]|uniref:Peroxidase-related enzyme n=1 Tax=Tunturiibacter empetritectus TaxID=3069691 RepID=A0AAU7ZCU3_9BACT
MIMREGQKLALDKLLPIQSTNLPIVNENDAPPEVERLYMRFRTDFGRPRVPGILQCFATHPPLLEHMMGLAQSMLFVDGALDRRHKELIATFVSSLNSCAYCADSHGFFLRTNGGSQELLTAVMQCEVDSKEFTSQQGSLLRFVQKITDDAQSVSRVDIELLHDSGWTDLQIAEAIHVTALFACFNRVVNAFGLPSQDLLSMYANAPQEEPGSSEAPKHGSND